MNATEQRTHRTVTEQLEARIATMETLIAQMSQNCDWLHARHSEQLQFRHRPLLARLKWLVLGR